MRTLVVDALRAGTERTAMGRYVERMSYWWSRTAIPFDQVLLVAPAPVTGLDLGTTTPVRTVPTRRRGHPLWWEQVELARVARGASVLFGPAYTAPVAHRGPLVVANHGIYEALPGEFSRLSRLRATSVNRASARRADRVLCNSGNTSADVQRFLGVRPERIEVVLPGAAEVFHGPHDPAAVAAQARAVLGVDAPYVLFVGKLARRRNVPNLVQAFAETVREHGLPHHLLVVGPDTSGVGVPALAAAAGLPDRVHHLPHLEQDALALLCAGTDAFALPTTYEGLSWTLLEAMAAGAPVLTVEHPTLDEGAGPAALVLPTPSVADLRVGLAQVLRDPALRADLRAASLSRAAAFSWQVAAERTMTVLDQVARPSDTKELSRWPSQTSPCTPTSASSSRAVPRSSAATSSTASST